MSRANPRPRLTEFWSFNWTVLVLVLLAVLVSLLGSGMLQEDLVNEHGLGEFGRFFGAALRPTLTSEYDPNISLLSPLIDAIATTLLVAFASMSLAISAGFVMGLLVSDSLWQKDPAVFESEGGHAVWGYLKRFFVVSLRAFLALTRSIHELVWALLFTAMFGLDIFSGILALAIPYAATLGRIYAELIDETPRGPARALRASGARQQVMFLVAFLPRAIPAMSSYTFFRFDCAVRSSAVLGFIGFPTLGLMIEKSFLYDHYGEVWTYLYALFAILVLAEWLSSSLRRRLQA